MGGDPTRLIVAPLGGGPQDEAHGAPGRDGEERGDGLVRELRVSRALCSVSHDRHRLLAAIEASFGALSRFDRAMRVLMLAAAERARERAGEEGEGGGRL